MSPYPEVALGDLLSQVQDAVTVRADHDYEMAGIYSFGRGIFRRPKIAGNETRYKKLYRLSVGNFVYSRLFGWEGALAVASADDDGLLFSHEFPMFDVDTSRVHIRYLKHIVTWPTLHERLRDKTTGMGNRRQRVNVAQLTAATIPLPDLAEQRRIADLLDRQLAEVPCMTDTRRLRVRQAALARFEDEYVRRLQDAGWTPTRLNAVADINPRRGKPDPTERVIFVPMSGVSDRIGSIVDPDIRTAADVSRGYTQFRSADVVFARITPCMQNGKCAIVDLPPGISYGYGSTEFHVIRSNGPISPAWIHFWLRRLTLRQEAMRAFTGTAGQQRVPASFLRQADILVPPDDGAEADALDSVRALHARAERVRDLQEYSASLARALKPALLNAAFSGQV